MTGRGLRGLAALFFCVLLLPAFAEEPFTDTSFQGSITTETLDAIIEKYELYDGWYWTGEAGVPQDYHGHEGKPGWTDTSVNTFKKTGWEEGWYGYRWGIPEINARVPNDRGYGECFGFAQFIGYLLSGERNPHANWMGYFSVDRAGGLRPGDIIRADYKKDGKRYQHSAVVYSVEGTTVLFIQVSGGNFNLIRTRQGYTDGNLRNETNLLAIRGLPDIVIYRYTK